jgi:hypothetical protein
MANIDVRNEHESACVDTIQRGLNLSVLNTKWIL